MTTHAAHAVLDEVDAYVDALLDAGPTPLDVLVPSDTAIGPVDSPIPDDADARATPASMPPNDPSPAALAPETISAPAVAVLPAAAVAAQPAPTPPTPPPPPRHAIASIPAPQSASAAPLRPDAAAAREDSARASPPPRELSAPQPQRWVRVAVDADSYALELLCVQEVVRLAPIVAMRGAAAAVLGVMNLRGRIVPVFDLGLWLGVGQVAPDEHSRIVVVEREDELIGVLVSAVEDVVTLSRDRIEPPVPGADPGPTLGVARVGPSPTVLLDAGALYH
jgi:purine-binding chemotaxis protein CheW